MLSQNKVIRKVFDFITWHLRGLLSRLTGSRNQMMENLMILQGRALALQNKDRAPLDKVQDAEFKVFSQYGEDGILQYLIQETAILHKERTFVEFGVQSYSEANTRFLLMNNHWKGLIIDGSQQYMDSVRRSDIYWRYDLTAKHAWIDRDNINRLIEDGGFCGDNGILSIDIDGNDYWVWERIEVVNPVIVVVEWNSVFGDAHAITIPYDPLFQREKAHYSCLYWGASIRAFEHLAAIKGYALICSNSAGNNLFFVRQDRLGRLKPLSAEDAYVESGFQDSRDLSGKLNFLGGEKRRQEILDLPVVDVLNDSMSTLRQLDGFQNK